MSALTIRRAWLGVLCAAALGLAAAAPSAQAAFDDPLFISRPVLPPHEPPVPPPDGQLEGACGLVVDDEGSLYVSDYFHDVVDVFAGFGPVYPYGYATQIANIDAFDGPCGLGLDADGTVYVNDYHRSVVKYSPSFNTHTAVAGAGTTDGTHPTGVAVDPVSGTVYVDERTQIAVFSAAGTLIDTLATGTLEDGYGLAFSEYIGSKGLLYVADAATDTIKIYASKPLSPGAGPVAEIDGSGTPLGQFVSLRDAAIAIDRMTGTVYVSDNLQPRYAERPETVIHAFDAAGDYLGRLKYSIENALPAGIAVDNSEESTQGRVYVTSGNTEHAAVYVYRPGSATTAAVPIPGSTIPPDPVGVTGTADPAAAAVSSSTATLAEPAAGGAVGAAIEAVTSRRAREHHQRKRRHAARHRHHAAKRSHR
jgi:DNA-binding beta-propeller fold protein YncE